MNKRTETFLERKKAFRLSLLLLLFVDAFCVQAQTPNPFGKALIPDMNADASIQMINNKFYCYATTDGYVKQVQKRLLKVRKEIQKSEC